MNWWIEGWMDKWMNIWMGGWMMERWKDRWKDGWINLFKACDSILSYSKLYKSLILYINDLLFVCL